MVRGGSGAVSGTLVDSGPASLVLIGGAPRTGTTMLLRAFDWHPEILICPREVTHLAELFYSGETATPDPSAKELVYGRYKRMDDHAADLDNAGDHEVAQYYRQEYDAAAFSAARRDSLERGHDYFRALYAAIISGSPREKARYGGRTDVRFAIKLPFFAEAWLAGRGGARLIHISRDPVARYLSAKARMRAPRVGARGVVDFTTFQAMLPSASLALARRATDACFVNYEDIRGCRDCMERIAAFLSVDWDDTLAQQSLHGFPNPLPSSYGFRNRGGDCDDELRASASAGLASAPELDYVALLDRIARGGDGSLDDLLAFGSQCFRDEAPDARAERVAFITGPLQSILDTDIGSAMAELLRSRRLGVL